MEEEGEEKEEEGERRGIGGGRRKLGREILILPLPS